MKTEKRLKDFTNEELEKEYKNRKIILIVFSVLIGIMVLASVVNIIKKGHITISLMPLYFAPLFFVFWNSFNEVKKEINSRK